MEFSREKLVSQALEARKNAYVPYSHFAVGAALLSADGRVWPGCNIENSSYSPTICAERTAFSAAIAQSVRDFIAIAIVGGPQGSAPVRVCPPCGVCRQVMREFCDPDTFKVILGVSEDNYSEYTLKELLPLSFGPGNLD